MRPIDILLVEDNLGDVELTREMLSEGNPELRVGHVFDGEQALDFLSHQRATDTMFPGLILLDLNLPKMNGIQTLAEIRSDATFRRIPVVVLTSSDAEHDVIASYESGANCYVTKPVGLAAFQEAVRKIEDFWFSVVKIP